MKENWFQMLKSPGETEEHEFWIPKITIIDLGDMVQIESMNLKHIKMERDLLLFY